MEQLVVLIIIGLVSLVNWMLQKSAEKREQAKMQREASRAGKAEARRNIYTEKPPVRRQTPAPSPAQDPLKELMEALGLPAGEAAPRVPPRLPQTIFEEEEIHSMEEPGPPPVLHKPAPVPAPRTVQPDEKMAQLASAFAAQEKFAPEKPRLSAVRKLLADRASKRHAIILTEILGPPRAFQPL